MRGNCVFFFSSRRRHTRLQGDWSSDVCSSDLADVPAAVTEGVVETALQGRLDGLVASRVLVLATELVVRGQRHIGRELGMGPERSDGDTGDGERLDRKSVV